MQSSVDISAPINWDAPENRRLLRWWLCLPGKIGGNTWRDLTGRNHATITGATGATSKGRPGGYGSYSYNGISHYAKTQRTVDLTGQTQITLEFEMLWTSFTNNDDICIESSADYNSNTNGIALDPNSSSGSNFFVGIKTSGGYNVSQFTRPSAAAWHHYLINFDRGAGAQQVTHVWVDGVAQSLSNTFTNTASGTFGNFTWNFMSRNGTIGYGDGRLDNVRLHSGLHNAAQAWRAFRASREGYPEGLRWYRPGRFAAEQAGGAPSTSPHYYRRRRGAA